jgi:hypothetical protein
LDALRTALSVRSGENTTPAHWRDVVVPPGAAGPHQVLCHMGRSVAAAIHAIEESAETVHAQLRHERARLLAAVNDRFDVLESRLTAATNGKIAALERELEAVDSALERWQRESRAVREAIASLADADIVQQHGALSVRLDGVEEQLRALATAVIEPPSVRYISPVTLLLDQIAGYGAIAAPLAVTAADLTLKGLPPYALRGGALRFHVALGDRHAGQSPEELEASLGHAVRSLHVDASLLVSGSPSQTVEAQYSTSPADRCIVVTLPLPPGAVGGSVSISGTSLAGRRVSVAPLSVPVMRGPQRGLSAYTSATSNADSIVAAILARISDANAVAKCCTQLLDLLQGPIGKETATDAGVQVALVAVLRAHSGDARVALDACIALCDITLNDAGVCAGIDAYAPSALVATIQAHAAVKNVVCNACSALFNLAANEAGQRAALDAGAPAALVSALRAQIRFAPLASSACDALGSIALIDDGKKAVIDAGAAAVCVLAMRTHRGNTDVSAAACVALRNIASSIEGTHATIRAGAPAAVIAALFAHRDDKDVSEYGCMVLACVGTVSAGKAAVLAAGGVAAIKATIKRHALSDRVLEALAAVGLPSRC